MKHGISTLLLPLAFSAIGCAEPVVELDSSDTSPSVFSGDGIRSPLDPSADLDTCAEGETEGTPPYDTVLDCTCDLAPECCMGEWDQVCVLLSQACENACSFEEEALPCDVLAQDVPAGHKCMPYSDDGTFWNATRIIPIDHNPGQPGDQCTVEASALTGVDSCDQGGACRNVDPQFSVGVCIALCTGDPLNPECADPTMTCVVTHGGILPVCETRCDPLSSGCGAGEACRPVGGTFVCRPVGTGEAGSICNDQSDCGAGMFCAEEGLAPCEEGERCCAEYCDVDDEDSCSGSQSCENVFLGEGTYVVGGCAW